MLDLAQRNFADAQYQLSNMFRYGHGVVKNKTLFIFWLDRAGKGGHEDAAALLRELRVKPKSKS
jgi:TPR repeat protein